MGEKRWNEKILKAKVRGYLGGLEVERVSYRDRGINEETVTVIQSKETVT